MPAAQIGVDAPPRRLLEDSDFWKIQTSTIQYERRLTPQAKIAGSYVAASRDVKRLTSIMLDEYQRASDVTPLQTVATTISEYGQFNISSSPAMQILERMVDEEIRFANLERVLGCGAVFLLCHAGSDAL
ncbi:hypothetical protein LTR49_022391 [Elasticomyces elasticus]|nr:hypothetical protein LTR49_022391 [Elasticomyces elasticus]